MGTKASCSKFKKKTNPPPTPKILQQKPDILPTQKTAKIHKKTKIPSQNIEFSLHKFEEIEKSLDFVSFLLLFADTAKLKCDVFTNDILLLTNPTEKKMKSQNKLHDFLTTKVEMQQEAMKFIDFLGWKQEKETIKGEKHEENNTKTRNSKEKNQKFLRNSLKSIKENSSSRVSNKFETDNESENEKNHTNNAILTQKNTNKQEMNTFSNFPAVNLFKNHESHEKNNQINQRKFESSPEKYDIEFENGGGFFEGGFQNKGEQNKTAHNALANLTYSKITEVEVDQTQSVFGRLSFGSTHINEKNLASEPEDRQENRQIKKKPTVESETESSIHNSKLKEQIIRILGQIDNGKDSKENLKELVHELSSNPKKPSTNTNNQNNFKKKEFLKERQEISEIFEEKEATSLYKDPTPLTSFERSPNKSIISNKTVTKSSINNKSSLTPTPKKKQLVVQNHYLNSKSQSYQAIMSKKKMAHQESYQKLLNTSNLNKIAENNSQMNANNNKNYAFRSKNFQHKENKIPEKKQKINTYFNEHEDQQEIIPALKIDLNLKMRNFHKKKENEDDFSNKNTLYIKDNLKKNDSSILNNSENEKVFITNLKMDIDNLKDRMRSPNLVNTSNLASTKITENKTGKMSLRDQINQALAKKNDVVKNNNDDEESKQQKINHSEDIINLENMMHLLPNYEENGIHDNFSDDDD